MSGMFHELSNTERHITMVNVEEKHKSILKQT